MGSKGTVISFNFFGGGGMDIYIGNNCILSLRKERLTIFK